METRAPQNIQEERSSDQLNDPPSGLRPGRRRHASLRKRSARDAVWSGMATLLLHVLMFAVMISPVLQLPIINVSKKLDFFWLSPFFTLDSGLMAKGPDGIAPPPLPLDESTTEGPGPDEEEPADVPLTPPQESENGNVSPLPPEESATDAEMVVPRKVLVAAPPQSVDDGIKPPPAIQEPEKERYEPPPTDDRMALLQAAEQERLAREEADRQAQERAEQERQRLEKERREQQARETAKRLQKAREEMLRKQEAERIAREKAEQELLARERAELERRRLEKERQDRLAKEAAERLRQAREELRRKEEMERTAREKAEQELLARERAELERQRLEKERQDRLAKEAAERLRQAREELRRKEEAERVAREKARQLQLAKERAERERQRLEKVRQDQLAREKAERERLLREEQRRLAEQRAGEIAEQERQARERARAARLAEDERRARELNEQNRLAAERAWLEQLARMKAEKELADAAKVRAAAATPKKSADREKPGEPKGIPLPSVNGEIKLTITGEKPVTVTAAFRPFAKSRRNRPLSRSESKREIAILPIMVHAGENTREAVVEKANEGVYVLKVAPAGAETKAAFTLTLYDNSPRKIVKNLGSRSVGSKSVLTRVLMPEGILWEEESAFSGSMEDSEGVTKFNSETGLVWKEYGE